MTKLQRQQAHNFHIYLNETLIPDLKDDGHIETAKDFRKAASYIEQLLRLSVVTCDDNGTANINA